MTKKKRILVCGGLASSLINFRGPLLRAMREQGHVVAACAANRDEAVEKELADMGITYDAVRLSRTSLNPLQDLDYLRDLQALIVRRRPDVVLGYTHKPSIYSALAARRCGVRANYVWITGLGYAFTESGSLKQHVSRTVISALYRSALRTTRAAFFQNPDDVETFRAAGILCDQCETLVTNGSGVDVERYVETAPPVNPIRFLLIARLLKDKGIREYVDALRIVRRESPTIDAQIVGPFDPNPSAIHSREVARWVAEGVVRYCGETDDVRPFLRECSVYVLPSYREGLPRTVLEAMSTGRPVITTDAPGCRSTVEPGKNGLLVPVGDSEALAEAMLQFVRNPAMIPAMGAAGRRLAVRKYDIRQVNDVLLNAMQLSAGNDETNV